MVRNRKEIEDAIFEYCNTNYIKLTKEKANNFARAIVNVMCKTFVYDITEEKVIKLFLVEHNMNMGQFLKTFFENYEFTENEGYKLIEIINDCFNHFNLILFEFDIAYYADEKELKANYNDALHDLLCTHLNSLSELIVMYKQGVDGIIEIMAEVENNYQEEIQKCFFKKHKNIKWNILEEIQNEK